LSLQYPLAAAEARLPRSRAMQRDIIVAATGSVGSNGQTANSV
jgi:hypothetical protein